MKRQRWGNNAREDDSESGRDKILQAAKRCYARQGIAATTLEQIAAEARITRRTVYRYFDSKKTIIQAVVDEQSLDFLHQMKDTLQDHSLDFSTQLERYLVYLVDYGQQAPGYQLLLGSSNQDVSTPYYLASRENYKLLESLIRQPFEQARAAGEIRPDLDFDALMAWMGRVVFSYIQVPASADIVATQIRDFVIPALWVSSSTSAVHREKKPKKRVPR